MKLDWSTATLMSLYIVYGCLPATTVAQLLQRPDLTLPSTTVLLAAVSLRGSFLAATPAPPQPDSEWLEGFLRHLSSLSTVEPLRAPFGLRVWTRLPASAAVCCVPLLSPPPKNCLCFTDPLLAKPLLPARCCLLIQPVVLLKHCIQLEFLHFELHQLKNGENLFSPCCRRVDITS